MYDITYENEYWWITKDGEILKELGGFIDCYTPKLIIKEFENEMDL